MEQKLQ
jgi:hypothetical protein